MKRKTIYQLLIDCSGSMQAKIEETVAGINLQVKHIREVGLQQPKDAICVYLYLFNHDLHKLFEGIAASEMGNFSFQDYHPDGLSALYDAIGTSIQEMQDKLEDTFDADNTHVVFMIFTDGHDNASQQYTMKELNETISQLIEGGRWTFFFIGNTLESNNIAEGLGIPLYNTIIFGVDSALKFYASQKNPNRTIKS